MSDKKRLLNDLRVIDLRCELEKRNLDKSGVRGVLILRLSKHLEEEGHDPATYRFDLSSEAKPAVIKTRHSESTSEPDSEPTPASDAVTSSNDQDHQSASGGGEEESQAPAAGEAVSGGTVEKMDVDENTPASRKRVSNDGVVEASNPKKPCVDNGDDLNKLDNNIDTEDSINLDIGDDELLNEEGDSNGKLKHDDGAVEDSTESPTDHGAADSSAPASGSQDDASENVNAAGNSADGEDESKEAKEGEEEGERDKKKEDGKEGGARNLWVSGLSGDTRAKDLKQLCSQHGKVIGAKIVTNARTPGSRCYGYVTMGSAQDAENCIEHLHRTELHGRMISVEKAKSEAESARRASRSDHRADRTDRSDRHRDDAKENVSTNKDDKSAKKEGETGASSPTPSSRERTARAERDRAGRTRSHDRRRSPRDVLSFSKIWKERDLARTRERSRAEREEERRRRAAEDALRERERRQRQEKVRLELEREKLRAEREKIEREKNELLRLERERHRLEREKLELERLELKRAQLRLEEERRKRGYEGGSAYRKPNASPPPEPAGYDRDPRHKRAPPPLSRGSQFEAPPPPRFEMGSGYDRGADKRDRDRDYKRDYRHPSSSSMKYPSNGTADDASSMKYPSNGTAADEARQPLQTGARPKEPRSYDSRDTRSYRPEPPGKPEPRGWNAGSRYNDAAPAKGTSSGGTESWSAGDARYGGSSYEARYAPAYQPPPPGASYPDRYAPPNREYRKY